MAVQTIQNLPQQHVTDLGVDYGKQLAGLTAIPLDTARLAPQVAAQDPLQTQAYNLAQSGVGAFQPFPSHDPVMSFAACLSKSASVASITSCWYGDIKAW